MQSLRLLPALLILVATGATASEWQYEGGSVPIAYVDNGSAQFQFACRGGELAMGFWVRAPHAEVAGASSLNLAILPDGPAGADLVAAVGASYAQDMPLIHNDGTSMIVRGPVAQSWARMAQQAKATLRLAFIRMTGGPAAFDANTFGAKGSAAAIRRVLDTCG